MIKLQVIGNLGKDCVLNNVNGKNVMNFSVAHSEKYKDAQGIQIDKSIWVDCAYWSDKTGIAPYLKKGTTVYVEGQPDVRTYTTQDGRSGSSLTLRVLSVQLLGSKPADGSTPTQAEPSTSNPANAMPPTMPTSELNQPIDDLPF